MNVYVVVEGEKAARKIYKTWIPIVNPELQYIDYLNQLEQNNFFILAGFGQSQFLTNQIEHAIKDVNNLPFDRLVLAIDSEDKSFQDKLTELTERVEGIGCNVQVMYVIQHFCFETWLLGNKQIFRRKTNDDELQKFRALFDVRNNDPELLPANDERTWNRSQFALQYLRAGLRDVHPASRVSYTKRNPGVIATEGYFSQVKKRHLDDQHILSFKGILEAFI
ncbi:MAG: DUF4276 family protein [Ignavibacteriaceae bacterium]|nr:DUF4276 family protein [Ignavibacteriaceae bacterium]